MENDDISNLKKELEGELHEIENERSAYEAEIFLY